MALDFTLLTEEQIWGNMDDNGQLEVMEKYGTKVALTDLAVLLGGYVTDGDDRTFENDLTGTSWSASSDYTSVIFVNDFGDNDWDFPYNRGHSVRPAVSSSEASKVTPSGERVIESGIRVAEYGEYPQTVVDKKTSEKLEELLESNSLHPTGKNYTFDAVDIYDDDTAFKAASYPEYELDGKKYIRVPGRPDGDGRKLSTGERVEEEKNYWVEVQPIEWLMDKSGWMVSKKCLFAGIQFGTKKKYNGNFSKTFMKKYLDTYFAKEMEPSELESEKNRKKVLTGLSAQLEAATGEKAVEAIKKRLKAAEKGKKTQTPPDRLEEAARMQRLMNARNILIHAAQQAYDAGDKALLDGIVDLSQHYEVLYNARKRRVASLQARRRVQRKQGDR